MVTGTMESSCLENSMGKHYYAWKERKEGKEEKEKEERKEKEGKGGERKEGKERGEGEGGERRRSVSLRNPTYALSLWTSS